MLDLSSFWDPFRRSFWLQIGGPIPIVTHFGASLMQNRGAKAVFFKVCFQDPMGGSATHPMGPLLIGNIYSWLASLDEDMAVKLQLDGLNWMA